ncbi:2Fe-2S iron-sulfur cluster-binding protein [Pannonibacter sp. Q-1]
MPRIIFQSADGTCTEVEAASGQSLMSAAVAHGIEEIAAECGGACACGTCHCYIPEGQGIALPEAEEMELAMIECVIDPRPQSRLTCQVTVSEAMDGLVVELPASQH